MLALLISTMLAVGSPAVELPCPGIQEELRGYEESLVWRGLSSGGHLIYVAQSVGGSWTILAVTPQGQCIPLDHGEDGKELPRVPVGDES